MKHTFGVEDISPYLSPEEAETFKKRLLAADNKGIFTPISLKDTVHVPTSNGGVLFGGTAARPGTAEIFVVAHENPGILRLLRPGEDRGGGPPAPPGQLVYQQSCQACHGPERQGTETGVPLVHLAADPANNITAGAPRFDAAAIRTVLATGKGRMASFPHLAAADVDALVTFLTAAEVEAGVGGRGARRRSSGIRRAAGVDCRIGFRVDAARARQPAAAAAPRRIRRARATSRVTRSTSTTPLATASSRRIRRS